MNQLIKKILAYDTATPTHHFSRRLYQWISKAIFCCSGTCQTCSRLLPLTGSCGKLFPFGSNQSYQLCGGCFWILLGKKGLNVLTEQFVICQGHKVLFGIFQLNISETKLSCNVLWSFCRRLQFKLSMSNNIFSRIAWCQYIGWLQAFS